MNHCKNIFLILLLLISIFIIFNSSYKFNGGKQEKNNKYKVNTILEDMIKNGNLNDPEKLKILIDDKKKYEDIVNKNNTIYTNLLTDLSSKDEDINIADINLEDSKNQLLLASINVDLKESIIKQKNNKNESKKEILDFYIKLNSVKQYNIYSLILINNIYKLYKDNTINTDNTLFKSELVKTLDFVERSYNKTNNLYKVTISSNNSDIISYKSDLSNSKVLTKQLKDNITEIQTKLNNKNKLNQDIKTKLSLKDNSIVEEITKNEEKSLFENLSTLFRGF